MVVAILAGDTFSGGLAAPVTAPALAACCGRLAPVLGRAAVALGASEAYQATYQGVRAYFNKADGRSSGTGKSGGNGPAPKKPEPRVFKIPRRIWTNLFKTRSIVAYVSQAQLEMGEKHMNL
ncbi:MAG: hypothetical protein LBR89_03645 [Holosporales bacterium]|nr:hypothetical protein [Holosporales bacterium]